MTLRLLSEWVSYSFGAGLLAYCSYLTGLLDFSFFSGFLMGFSSRTAFLHFFTFSVIGAFTFTWLISSDVHAAPGCQVLDNSTSRLDLTLDLFGDVKKTKVDNIKAFLWIDPEHPEGANLVASLEPKISQLFGKFEENPLLIGMLGNYLDKEIVFKSISVTKKAENDRYKVIGQVTSGNKKYPANFNVLLDQVGRNESRFYANVESDNFQKFLGTPGSAKGNFDLLFRAKPQLTKELCAL